MQIDVERTLQEKQAKVKKDFNFASVPLEMGDMPQVTGIAIKLYVVLYGFCPNWRAKSPTAEVSQKMLADILKIPERQVRLALGNLKETGWVSIKRQGLNKPNQVILHGHKKRI